MLCLTLISAFPLLTALLFVIWHIAQDIALRHVVQSQSSEAPLSSWVCQIMYCVLGNVILTMSLIKF